MWASSLSSLVAVSWNVCGGISQADRDDFVHTVVEDCGVRPDVFLLQECALALQSMDLAASGYCAFSDGRQRGNGILLSSRLERSICGQFFNDTAFFIGLHGESPDVRHILVSAHLPYDSTAETYENAVSELLEAVATVRQHYKGLLLVGVDANVAVPPQVPPLCGSFVSAGAASEKARIFLDGVQTWSARLINTFEDLVSSQAVLLEGPGTRRASGDPASGTQYDYIVLHGASATWSRLWQPRASPSDHALLLAQLSAPLSRVNPVPRQLLTRRGWLPTLAGTRLAHSFLDELPEAPSIESVQRVLQRIALEVPVQSRSLEARTRSLGPLLASLAALRAGLEVSDLAQRHANRRAYLIAWRIWRDQRKRALRESAPPLAREAPLAPLGRPTALGSAVLAPTSDR